MFTDGTNKTLQTTNNGLNVLNINKVTTNHNGIFTCVATQTYKDRVTSTSKVCGGLGAFIL